MPPPLTDELLIANALRNQALPQLERLAQNSSLLDDGVRRFDNDEPPPYTSSTEEDEEQESLWPARDPIESLSDESMRLIERSLDDKERVDAAGSLAYSMRTHRPGTRYDKELTLEKARIESWARCRASPNASDYLLQLGPAKRGRAGRERVNILARRNIKRRWQKLGVWNQHWGIPERPTNHQPNDETYEWKWRWEQDGDEWQRGPHGPDVLTRNQHHLVVRCLNLRRGLCRSEHIPVQPHSHLKDDAPKSQAEAFLISRPWFVHDVASIENYERFHRLDNEEKMLHGQSVQNVTELWKQFGEWKDSWKDRHGDALAGWKWRHESPSPEPEDLSAFNDISTLELTSSEADALDAVRPPSPPTPHSPTPDPLLQGGPGLFGRPGLFGHPRPLHPPSLPPPYPVEVPEPAAETGEPEPDVNQPQPPARRSARIAAMATRRAAEEAARSTPTVPATRKRRANGTAGSRPAETARAFKRTRIRR